MRPLWDVLHNLVPREPTTLAQPAHWRYADVAACVHRAGELISAEKAERRVLILENPALQGQSRITGTLYAGLQLILPGEVAPCHRHTQSALRFIVEGDGAFTAVDGERAYMRRWDLILTPPWTWHDHGNESSGPMVWLDGLDIPLVAALDAGFAETFDGGKAHPQTRPPGSNLATYGANLRPVQNIGEAVEGPRGLFIYPHTVWRPALQSAVSVQGLNPHDGLRMEFVNPVNGGSVLPTMSAFSQLIPAGMQTRAARSTDGSVYVVVEGHGRADVGDHSFELQEGDIFVVPAWSARRFKAEEDLVLFSYSDRAAQERLELWREQLS
jgi:gentisate 1,2-dioxygenase